ncbi:CBS domain-containing protein [Actibacterium sp. XHP0104]|uniref:CBS domain-containing protein n=1 Tax=Actibacterium sp. XHP0104 TaxID=2984335 RepID=UPI0021E81F66|nr:CBS domain-containing protein [Actibacterium sp. XHP0104]MCV2882240.1 CBS domain-containing protein [Actibacterium sp. XHP0104]
MLITSIREILAGRPLYSVPEDASVAETCRQMAEHATGAVLVLGPGGVLAGVLTERDVVCRVVAEGRDAAELPVAQVMTRDPVSVDIDDALSDALAARIGGSFRHLPVLDDGVPVGILSAREIPADYRMMFERFQELSH